MSQSVHIHTEWGTAIAPLETRSSPQHSWASYEEDLLSPVTDFTVSEFPQQDILSENWNSVPRNRFFLVYSWCQHDSLTYRLLGKCTTFVFWEASPKQKVHSTENQWVRLASPPVKLSYTLRISRLQCKTFKVFLNLTDVSHPTLTIKNLGNTI